MLPTPDRLYVYNDFPYLRAARARSAAYLRLLATLEHALAAEPHVVLVEVAEQIRKLAERGNHQPFSTALAIGGAGGRVARDLHALTGWFPMIEVLALTREETATGAYRMRGEDPALDDTLALLPEGALALVDDTIYSGQTLLTVLERLPAARRRQTTVFCLQAIAATLPRIRRLCAVEVGLEMPGTVESEVSVIKASHLFETGAIRRAEGDLAFFERQEWMAAWFPRGWQTIAELCAQLHALELA